MAKKVEQQRVAKVGNDVQLEQTIASDDSLLPSAKELTAYKEVDENIVPWLLEQTAKEQLHRHESDLQKMRLLRKSLNTDRLVITFFFLIVLIFVGLSAFFVYTEKNISGSIFGICGIVGSYILYRKLLRQ